MIHGCPCCDGRMDEDAPGVWFCMDCEWRSDEDDNNGRDAHYVEDDDLGRESSDA